MLKEKKKNLRLELEISNQIEEISSSKEMVHKVQETRQQSYS